jgi:Na+/phosphate symporter
MEQESTKDVIKKFYHMNQKLIACISLLEDAFVFNNMEFVDKCATKANDIRQVTNFLSGAGISDDVRVYMRSMENIDGMVDCISQICANLRIKIRNSVVFSERAVLEVSFLLARLQDVLKHLSDIVLSRKVSPKDTVESGHYPWASSHVPLSRDVILCEYVLVSVSEIIKNADEFIAMHQGRLVVGICDPTAAPLFMHMLDAIKEIAKHAREVADKLAE